MAGDGTLTIATRNDGHEVVLEVTDDGVGMDDETRVRLFEPFFTTKDVGEGTGLGLSTVYGIVAQSGGSIDVRSAPGLGATFMIRLPVTHATPREEHPVAAAPAGGVERILVVDDEKVVRELLAQMLREQGYDVEVAGTAREARALDGPWDLLLTDVVMPETDGVKLSKQIDARHVLFISGYDQEALVAGDASFLQKPFSRDELTARGASPLRRRRMSSPARTQPERFGSFRNPSGLRCRRSLIRSIGLAPMLAPGIPTDLAKLRHRLRPARPRAPPRPVGADLRLRTSGRKAR